MKKLLSLVTALCLVLAGCTAHSSDSSLEKITVSEVTHSVFYAPQYVALNLGYFEDVGLDVELINSAGADKVMTAVLSESADIGLAGAEACIYLAVQGKENPPKVFSQLTSCDGSFLVGRSADEDFSWQDLKGKTILPGRVGGMPYMTLLYALNQEGLEVGKDVFFDSSMQFDAMTGAFVGGVGDYVTAFEPVGLNLEKEGKGYTVASVGEKAGKVPYTVYFANSSLDEDTIQSFAVALARGQQFVQENTPEETAKAIQPSFETDDLDTLTQAVKRYKEIGAYSQSGVMSEDDFDRIIDIMVNAGELERDGLVNFNDIIDNKYAQKAIAVLDK